MEKEEEYEMIKEAKFEDNLIKQITFDNLRKKNNHIRHLLSKIQQQVVDNSVAKNNSHSEISTENDSNDHLVNVVFSNNIEMINTPTFPRPEFCKTTGIKAIWVSKTILQIK